MKKTIYREYKKLCKEIKLIIDHMAQLGIALTILIRIIY